MYSTGSLSVSQTVDSADDVGAFASLALDAAGDPHIGYWDFTNRDLKYAHRSGWTWSVQVVDFAGDTGDYSSLALDANGKPHFSYSSSTGLRYAYTTCP
jgi:hypothetical protein